MKAALEQTAARHSSSTLQRVFANCLGQRFNTRLVGGASEPLYAPATQEIPEAIIYYRADYFASALHEVAHWCIAGEERRRLVDFGYWYTPDGRSPEQQRAFEQVECRPQALEWLFSKACAFRFNVSVDNLQGLAINEKDHAAGFKQQVVEQACKWQGNALPERASLFYRALCHEFGTHMKPSELVFTRAELE